MKRTLLPLLLIGSACATEQQRTNIPIEVSARVPTAATEKGWTITLDSARAHVGPVRFFEGHVLLSELLLKFLLLPIEGTAQAHPGHYIPGASMGELLDGRVVDLLAETPQALGVASAVTGEYGSLELSLLPPSSGADPDGTLLGHSIRVLGIASKDAQVVRFDAYVDIPKAIEGIRSEATVDKAGARVRIDFDLTTWFSRIDFSTAVAPDSASSAVLPNNSEAQNALYRGVTDTSAYVVTWAR